MSSWALNFLGAALGVFVIVATIADFVVAFLVGRLVVGILEDRREERHHRREKKGIELPAVGAADTDPTAVPVAAGSV